ncbi:unnamed protein product [Moneuplotes crassus]|uniref:Uncharacterized protein n=1 Tax=Euplotes crassus TaxID=5936 RepID=A0AAD1X831_EUPCR|nr:unnamed protein product [Moneuplotes crassus]
MAISILNDQIVSKIEKMIQYQDYLLGYKNSDPKKASVFLQGKLAFLEFWKKDYESFCDQIYKLSEENKLESQYCEGDCEENDNKDKSQEHPEFEPIIEEGDSIATSSDYSPMDRIETEPVKKKRETLSSLFRRSKMSKRGCKSNTSFGPTSSSESESIDINQLSQSSESESSIIKEDTSESRSSASHNYVAGEIEEGIHFTMSSGTLEGQDTFESKPSQTTYIDSNEEFRYSDRDILPTPLNLELVKKMNKFEDKKATITRNNYVEPDSCRDNVTNRNLQDLSATRQFNTTKKLTQKQVWTERNINPLEVCTMTSKIGSERSGYKFLSDDNSTFRGGNPSSNKKNATLEEIKGIIQNQSNLSPDLENYCDKISKMMHLMTDSDDKSAIDPTDKENLGLNFDF